MVTRVCARAGTDVTSVGDARQREDLSTSERVAETQIDRFEGRGRRFAEL